MADEALVDKAKQVLADTFVLYMKAHGYHWNIIGSNFPQLHGFFGDLYIEVHGAVDILAEELRQLDSFSPGTLKRLIELSVLSEDDAIPKAEKMVTNLLAANDEVMKSLTEVYNMAEDQNEFAYSNVIQDRLSAHAKHRWMLKALSGQKS